MRFDLISLNLVLAVAQTRSLTKGAAQEHLALAAASRRINDLETRLGVRLFTRHARGVELTPAGQVVVRHVRNLNASLQSLQSEVAEFAQGVQGHIRIVANASALTECLPQDLAAFCQQFPQLRISLEDQTSEQVQYSVAHGLADVGIFAPPVLEPNLETLTYKQARLAVLCPAVHALVQGNRSKKVTLAQVLEHDLVGLHVGASVQHELQAQAARLDLTVRARLQVRGFDAIAQLVQAGLGIAVLPLQAATRLAQTLGLQVLTLDEAWAQREFLIGLPKSADVPLPAQRFAQFLAALALETPKTDELQSSASQKPPTPAKKRRKKA